MPLSDQQYPAGSARRRSRRTPRGLVPIIALAWGVLLSFLQPALLAAPAPAPAEDTEERRLRIVHTHTNERIDVVYYRDGEYLPDALERLDHLLRDHRSDAIHEIDPELLDPLWKLARAVDNPDGECQIICGYRSPATNEMLRGKSSGVAKRSQHLLGKAIDVRLTGTDTAELHRAALELELGGVGFYKKTDFVHVDTGRVRRW